MSASLAYTGDTGVCSGLTKLAEAVNVLLCEATAREQGSLTAAAGHLTASQAGELASESNAQVLVLTHLSRQDPHWLAGLLEDAQATFDGIVGVASTHLKLSVPETAYRLLGKPEHMLAEP
jgi:ribonuclease BN (tRNA processing enzyme)